MNQIGLRLRECMDLFEARTGEHATYAELAEATGLSEATVQSIGSREGYNATLAVVERLCIALHVSPHEMIAWDGRPVGDA